MDVRALQGEGEEEGIEGRGRELICMTITVTGTVMTTIKTTATSMVISEWSTLFAAEKRSEMNVDHRVQCTRRTRTLLISHSAVCSNDLTLGCACVRPLDQMNFACDHDSKLRYTSRRLR
jgi:hypothetical protein